MTVMWACLGAETDQTNADFDIGVLKLEGDGRPFQIHIHAPKKANAEEYYSAIRAAAAFYYQSAMGKLPADFEGVTIEDKDLN